MAENQQKPKFPVLATFINRLRERKFRERLVDHTIDAGIMGLGDNVRRRVDDRLTGRQSKK